MIATPGPEAWARSRKNWPDILEPKHKDRMVAGATTVAVVPEKEEVQVTYMRGRRIKDSCGQGCDHGHAQVHYAAHRGGAAGKQSDAMHQIRYIPYPVVNLIFDKPVFNHGYDTWCPGNSFTDFIVADWVIQKQPGYQQKFNILSCYTPMKEDERSYLLTETERAEIAANVLSDFQKLMPSMNVDPVEVHIYRRGHPLYMSTPGLYTQVQPLVRQPMDRIFFANTDSEGPVSTTNGGDPRGAARGEGSGSAAGGKPAPKQKAVAG